MEYSVKKLAAISGISPRTLRYYDEIGLLSPKRINSSGYRIYGAREVDRLQDILLYRSMGLPLETIKDILSSEDFDRERALGEHLLTLLSEKQRIETLISNVQRTLDSIKGGKTMTDESKFYGLKKKSVDENEAKYGAEARAKYGDNAVNDANERVLSLTSDEWSDRERLESEIASLLKAVCESGSESGDDAKALFAAHKRWLLLSWRTDMYSAAAHRGLADMYVSDERFRKYYDDIVPGGAEMMKKVIYTWCEK